MPPSVATRPRRQLHVPGNLVCCGAPQGFTRPTCEKPNIPYLNVVDPSAAEDTLLGVLNGG